jgi:integrase
MMATVCKREWEYPKGSGNWKHAWYVAYKVDGKWKRKTAKPNKKHVADTLKAEIERDIADGKHMIRRGTETVGEAAEEWFHDRRKLAAGTLENYRRSLDLYILPDLGRIKLCDLKSERIERWVEDQEERGHKYAHVGAYWVLWAILCYAAKRMRCPNPLVITPITPPEREDAKVVIGTRQEIRALLEAAVTPLRRQGVRAYAQEFRAAIIMLAVLAGLRKGEIAGLQWENVLNDSKDALGDKIRVRHSQSKYGLGPTKTKAGLRDIWMARELQLRLTVIWERQKRPVTGYVFATGRPTFFWNNIWHCYFVPTMRQAGLEGDNGKQAKFSLHSLRHVAGSLWIEQGVPLLEVSRMMGHANPAITLKIYAHEFADHSKGQAAIEAIGEDLMPKLLPAPDGPQAKRVVNEGS